MKKIEAKIIADSKNEFGDRITTFILTFPRFILAELNTHRLFSRNSASSRAIPFKKMVKMIEEDPFIPIAWQKDHKGMQGSEYFEGQPYNIVSEWIQARDFAIKQATELNNLGVTKQICNRILEPFMWHTAIVTATEYENFFALRANEEAEIHIKELAERMLQAYNESKPELLETGDWHIPFRDQIDNDEIYTMADTKEYKFTEIFLKIATAKCARVSYLNHNGENDYRSDVKLHDRLLKSGHFSPFEHCARVMSPEEYNNNVKGLVDFWDIVILLGGKSEVFGWSGNFRGFIQYRKTLKNECQTDNRVLKK